MAPRRLTVLQDTSADEERPAWQWRPIGVLFVLCIWMPLWMIAGWVGKGIVNRAVGEGDWAESLATAPLRTRLVLWLTMPVLALLSFGLSCWAAGALVGRFGGTTRPRHAAEVGAFVAVAVSLLVEFTNHALAYNLAAAAVLLPCGIAAGWLGGRYGVRLRRSAGIRPPPPPP